MQYTKNVKILIFKEDPPPFEILIHLFFLLLDGFGFAVDFLEHNSHKVHLTLGKGLQFVNSLLALVLGHWCFESLDDFFIVKEFFLLELALHLFRVEKL